MNENSIRKGEKMKDEKEERTSRKKSKHKRVSEETKEGKDLEAQTTSGDANENSRSNSRSRKSLSSFFKKSGDSKDRSRSRSESTDKSKAQKRTRKYKEDENADPYAKMVDPRLDPREHFRRMTVREALRDSRARGRSPGRPTAHLERTVLDLTAEGHRDSLSSSAPHLLDILSGQENNDCEWKTTNKPVSGSTLPRSRHHRHRGHSADPSASKRTKTEYSDSSFPKNLPLDKRKYLIDKHKLDSSNQESRSVEINTVEPHSISQEPIIPLYAPSSYFQDEKSRRESFNQFLQLRDTIPNRYSSSPLSGGKEPVIHENQLQPQNTDQTSLKLVNEPNKAEANINAILSTYQETVDENKATPGILSNKQSSKQITETEVDDFEDCCSSSPLESVGLNKQWKLNDKEQISFQNNSVMPESASHFLPVKSNNQSSQSGTYSQKQLLSQNSYSKDSEMKQNNENLSKHLDKHESAKFAYVSPRTFSRTPKTSFKSDSSSSSIVLEEQPSFPQQTQLSIENETNTQFKPVVKPKYQRHFSRKKSNEKKVEKDTVTNDADTANQEVNLHSNVKQSDSIEKESDLLRETDHNNSKVENAKMPNPAIQIGSKTYIAAVSAFKALLRKNTNESKPSSEEDSKGSKQPVKLNNTSNNNNQLVEIQNSLVPKEIPTSEAMINSRTEEKANDSRPQFSLSSEKEISSVKSDEELSAALLPDDEVFHIFQPSITHPETENTAARNSEICHENTSKDILSNKKNSTLAKQLISQDITPFLKDEEQERHFRRVSDQTSDSEESERRSSLPIISDGLIRGSHSIITDKGKATKAKSEHDISDTKETGDKDEHKDSETVAQTTHVKQKKGKEKQRKKKGKGKNKRKKNNEMKTQVMKEQCETARKGILKKHSEDQIKGNERDIEKTSKKDKLKRDKKEIEKKPLVGKRSTSLTDIRQASIEDNQIKTPKKSKSSIHIRSSSLENISAQKKADRKKSKSSIDKGMVEKTAHSESKPARLSISAVVLFKQKIARMRKAKQKAAEARTEKSEEASERAGSNDEKGLPEKIDDGDKALIENEVNVSLGKLTGNSENDVIDEELENIYERKIKFDPYCTDDISEEELIKQRQRNTRLTSRRESKVRQRQKKVISCCKKFIAFLFSHIGLCSLMVAYSIAGGFIFQELEAPYEMEKNNEMEQLRLKILQDIWDLAFEVNISKGNRAIFKEEVGEILKNYSQRIQRETKESGWDGDSGAIVEGEDVVKQAKLWSFPSSLLFAITVMTTIGYGHVAPKTDTGRIVTIAYAVLGIPLTLLCLTNIGDVMAHGFRMLYAKVCCGVCCLLFRPSRRRLPDPEKGLQPEEQRMMMQEEEKSSEVVHVPTSICILLMASYIMLGTLLFARWEGWDPITGTYFCFITLSTIGFGDVVPGTDSNKWDEKEKLVLCAMYLVFGLSLIAMCFNLVQEDVKAKCRWLGMKLGIIDKPVSAV